jgi:hypothetical protein
VSVLLPPEVIDVGLSEAVAPAGVPETVKLIVCALPEVIVVEMVLVPDVP